MEILLIRHGATRLHDEGVLVGWNNDPGLSQQGRSEIYALAQLIKEKHFSSNRPKQIHTSSLPRAIETGEILSEMLSLELMVHDCLKDINMGEWAGQRFEDVSRTPLGVKYFEDPRGVRLPGGETVEEMRERVLPFVQGLKSQYQRRGEVLIIVTHLEVIKIILSEYLNINLEKLHDIPEIPTGGFRLLQLD